MNQPGQSTSWAPLRGAAVAFVLLACCGGATPGRANGGVSIFNPGPAAPAPCGLSASTQFDDSEKLVKALKVQTPPDDPTASDLDGHCNAVWQEAVDSYYCGEVALPLFCNKCTVESEKSRCFEGNGHGLVMQRCYAASVAPFNANYGACKDFAWCNGKLQLRTTCN